MDIKHKNKTYSVGCSGSVGSNNLLKRWFMERAAIHEICCPLRHDQLLYKIDTRFLYSIEVVNELNDYKLSSSQGYEYSHRKGWTVSNCSKGLHCVLLNSFSNRLSTLIRCCFPSSKENFKVAGKNCFDEVLALKLVLYASSADVFWERSRFLEGLDPGSSALRFMESIALTLLNPS